MTLRLLAIHAHPDDESSKGAATYAYYRSRGVRVLVLSCTGGERGSILNEEVQNVAMAHRDIAGLRRQEMAAAQAALDIEHRWLGFVDSGMPDEGEPLPVNSFATIPLEYAVEPVVRIIREFRPHVLTTYDENGGYPHPDHIRTHEVSIAARAAAEDPNRFPEAGAAWHIPKLYYDRIFNPSRMAAVHEHMMGADADHPLVAELERIREWMKDRPDVATSHVPAGDFFEARDRALLAHASQVAPDSSFFFWPNDTQRAAWPWEDFQLVDSSVPTELPEHDLFAGITPEREETS